MCLGRIRRISASEARTAAPAMLPRLTMGGSSSFGLIGRVLNGSGGRTLHRVRRDSAAASFRRELSLVLGLPALSSIRLENRAALLADHARSRADREYHR